MYFLDTETFKLVRVDHPGESLSNRYAILSHTWGDGEVLFSDLQESPHSKEFEDLVGRVTPSNEIRQDLGSQEPDRNRDNRDGAETENQRNRRLRRARQKKGWSKIEACCREARKYGVCLVWIDTCCINKDSSAELSEAINSMFE